VANVRWRGGAQAIAQVTTVTVTGYDAATTYTLTLNEKAISVLGDTDVNATATALAEAWNASEEPDVAEVTASTTGASGVITLTGPDGVPFTVASSVSGGGGTVGAATQVTAATGPMHWDQADNWDTGTVPVNADNVYLEYTSDPIRYGLAQSAVTLASLHVAASFTGELGLRDRNQSGYVEYRARELAIGATVLQVGFGPGQGSGLIRVNGGSVNSTVTVRHAAAPAEADRAAVRWRGTGTNVVEAYGGTVGIAADGGVAATVGTVRVGGNAAVRCGAGVTHTTLVQDGGTVELNAAITTITKTGGDLAIYGTGTVGTLTNDGGAVYYNTSGTLQTACRVGSQATLTFANDLRAKTVTPAVDLYGGGSLLDPAGVVTFTAGVRLNRIDLDECTLRVGQNKVVSIA
jgi:hypothetical protein